MKNNFKQQPLKIFIGYDSREDIAWEVCRASLLRHSSIPLQIQPLKLDELIKSGIYQRTTDHQASTEFTISRFLTPALANTEAWSMFVDCDFLFTTDIADLVKDLSSVYAAYVVKHEYTPALSIKMDGKIQHQYPRKNWSSLMLFNGQHPKTKALKAKLVNSSSPAYLHRFEWLNDDEIGTIDKCWNFLVGDYAIPDTLPKGIHFTNGGPWMDQWRDIDYAELWLDELSLMKNSQK